jgi:hypothetical protein
MDDCYSLSFRPSERSECEPEPGKSKDILDSRLAAHGMAQASF